MSERIRSQQVKNLFRQSISLLLAVAIEGIVLLSGYYALQQHQGGVANDDTPSLDEQIVLDWQQFAPVPRPHQDVSPTTTLEKRHQCAEIIGRSGQASPIDNPNPDCPETIAKIIAQAQQKQQAEQARLAQQRLEQEQKQREAAEAQARLEEQRLEQERKQREAAEAQARLEEQRLEQERKQREAAEVQKRLEQQRLAQARKKRQTAEQIKQKKIIPPEVDASSTHQQQSSSGIGQGQVTGNAQGAAHTSGSGRGGHAGAGGRGQGGNSYQAGLRAAIEQHKHYPSRARRMGITGTVIVGFVVQADGRISQVSIVRATSDASLNKAAGDAVKAVGQYQPTPNGKALSLSVPLRFSLNSN